MFHHIYHYIYRISYNHSFELTILYNIFSIFFLRKFANKYKLCVLELRILSVCGAWPLRKLAELFSKI